MWQFVFVLLFLAGASSKSVPSMEHKPMELTKENQPQVEPKRCCGPDMVTAKISQVVDGVYEGRVGSTRQSGIIYIDYAGQRSTVNVTVIELRSGYAIHVLAYRIGADMYTAVPKDKSCTKSKAVGAALQKCVPKTAVYVGKRKYGDPVSGLDADVWHYKETKEGEYDIDGLLAINTETCSPISDTARMTGAAILGAPVQNLIEMYDLLREVKDKTVFDLPDYCQKTKI